jgi:hypothetical protein
MTGKRHNPHFRKLPVVYDRVLRLFLAMRRAQERLPGK